MPDSGSDNIEEKGTRQIGHESSALRRSFTVRIGRLSMIGSMRSILHRATCLLNFKLFSRVTVTSRVRASHHVNDRGTTSTTNFGAFLGLPYDRIIGHKPSPTL